ncbi:hypothetical protein [Streptomyces nodosus]|uniref:Uncharacterized protein n=1 Tax=Streptomyces nodosus TaxID=40318 RepID=A0A0B5D8M3_9ACTN|nr:hypothetical protein [Streptomyces nodosus]AJE39838.1 hypothetical protein SNOD_07250 [Streptomyces nodosus]MBB4790818.1 hypothetical protein [Streptomyces nodosus]QEV38426.1 hypothetical protein CP978_07585 [Streptomyces nodosus]
MFFRAPKPREHLSRTELFTRRLALLFLLPIGWGLFQLAGALPASGDPTCAGILEGEDGEETPGSHLRPGQTCTRYDGQHRTGSQTFEEALNLRAQHQRELLLQGAVLTGYGVIGLTVTFHHIGLPRRRADTSPQESPDG